MDVEDTWSEASEEIEEEQVYLQPRAYQIEMFQESMKQNTIVTVSFTSSLTPTVLRTYRWRLAVARP